MSSASSCTAAVQSLAAGEASPPTSTAVGATPLLLTPAQFRHAGGTAIIRHQSPAKLHADWPHHQLSSGSVTSSATPSATAAGPTAVANMDLMEAFRLARQQYNAANATGAINNNSKQL